MANGHREHGTHLSRMFPCTHPMHRLFRPFQIVLVAPLLLTGSLLGPSALAQSVKNRILASVDDRERSVLPGSMSPRAKLAEDTGELDPATALNGVTISFAPLPEQQADLDALITAQQNPASPLYHQWLTPEQFGARFGLSDADLAKVKGWLQSQGFTVNAVARSRNQITFSGTAAQVGSAFRAPLHSYREGTERHFATSADLALPSGFASLVSGVGNLSDFRPKPHLHMRAPEAVTARFTSSQSGNHFLTPKDIATLYDVSPAYNAGYNGSGQTIAVIGQSNILNTDIAAFQTAAGLPVVAPTPVLVPNSGTPTVYAGDAAESDLDIEYSGGIAPGATILLVYTGNNANYGAFDSLTYAINERIAPVISVSYGTCEAGLSSTSFATRNATLAQAAAQGQTVVAASGDSGSTDCSALTTLPTATQQGLAVDFPASSPYVTGMGGTEFSSTNSASSNSTYWASASGSDVISSVLSYIPEQVWNDDSTVSGVISLSASGGGTSTLSARPAWQTGVSGIPAGNFRVVPDVSLASSPVNVGYIYCSSDSSTGVSGSCSNGFRDVNNTTLTIAGGTSFAAPIFAGMVAIINQARNSTGQGVINPTLYSLASNATTYAAAFHDITSGTNACTSGVSGCSAAGAASFAAAVGYDQATGLGSVDFFKLLSAWPAGTAATGPAASALTLSPALASPSVSTADVVTIKVVSRTGSATPVPTGSVSLLVDGASSPVQVTLSGGVASYTFSSAVSGTHTIIATYNGDASYAASTTSLILTVGAPASTAAFAISVPNVSVSAGSSAASQVTVTASNGYSGTISWSLAVRTSIANFCYSISNVTLPASAPSATTTLTVYTSSAACSSTTIKTIRASTTGSPTQVSAGSTSASRQMKRTAPVGLTLAGLFGVMLLGCGKRKLRPLLALTILAGLGIGLSGCSSSSTATTISTTNANTATGTYTFTLTGTDTASSAINSSTTFTGTVK